MHRCRADSITIIRNAGMMSQVDVEIHCQSLLALARFPLCEAETLRLRISKVVLFLSKSLIRAGVCGLHLRISSLIPARRLFGVSLDKNPVSSIDDIALMHQSWSECELNTSKYKTVLRLL